jgi:hypothetical protein
MSKLINAIPDILFKKYSGVVDTSTLNTVNQEPPVLASPKIFPSLQIYNQYIPPLAPTDLITDFTAPVSNILDLNGDETDDLTSLCEKREYSEEYPWMVKYTNLKLTDEGLVDGYSYKFAGTNPQVAYLNETNLLSQTIPFNYDPALTYQYFVYIWNGNTFISTKCDNSVNPWVLDVDAGYLTFYGQNKQLAPPLVTFWRYEGTFGFDVSGGGGGGPGPTIQKKTLAYYISTEETYVPTQAEYINIDTTEIGTATRIDINNIDLTGASKNDVFTTLDRDDLIYITTNTSKYTHIYRIIFIQNNTENDDWTFTVEPLNPDDDIELQETTDDPEQIFTISFDLNSNRIPITKIKF